MQLCLITTVQLRKLQPRTFLPNQPLSPVGSPILGCIIGVKRCMCVCAWGKLPDWSILRYDLGSHMKDSSVNITRTIYHWYHSLHGFFLGRELSIIGSSFGVNVNIQARQDLVQILPIHPLKTSHMTISTYSFCFPNKLSPWRLSSM